VSTFSGLSGALSSLYAQRRGMDVTGQNIANANTEGYTRQRVNLEAVGGSPIPAMYSIPDGSVSGVTITDVSRLQDAFMENRARAEHANNEYLSGQAEVYSRIEQAFGEPSDTGLQAQLSQFWSAWHDLANQPGDAAARTQVIARGQTVAITIRRADETLSSMFSATRAQLDASVTDVNTAADQLAQLNQAIIRAKQGNLPINEMSDRRDQLIMHLSELTGATAVPRDNGATDVYLGGSPLVNGISVRHIAADGPTRLIDQAATPVSVSWVDGGAVGIQSGQFASALETLNTTLPTYSAKLDSVAASLAQTVNDQHAAGFDLNGNAGGEFFTGNNGDPITASTITVAITDNSQLAASTTGGGVGDRNGDNADLLAYVANLADGPDRLYREVVVNLGSAAQTAERRATIQESLTNDLDAARQAQAGVNLDEEMTNLITYQRAYQAASRVINTVDEMLDTLINHTGLVGR
jgi:flagellar hook-associated protein 1 FlgK